MDEFEKWLVNNPGWISVDDKLPEVGENVKVLCWMFNNFTIEILTFNGVDFIYTFPNGSWCTEKVSHWRYQFENNK